MWNKTHDMNKVLAHDAATKRHPLDVVFLGDSITELWHGRMIGQAKSGAEGNPAIFRQYFTRQGGGSIEGLALGIANDKIGNLLYRIRSKEIPDALEAKIFWILIGTNDLHRKAKCSPEVVAAGIINIIQELQQKRPNSIIVINSILPTTGFKSGVIWQKPAWEDQIQGVNRRIECYAQVSTGVEFFNATPIFVELDGRRLNTTLLPDLIHPSTLGYKLWGQEIARKIQQLLPS